MPETLIPSQLNLWRLNEVRLVEKYLNRPQKDIVSVIMPTYNRAYVICRAVESVLKQSYSRFELLISDDGSTDDTEARIAERFGHDDRIRYERHEHGGVSRARNLALERSTGKVITYLDSDNVWSEHYLLLMVNSLLENSSAQSIYCGIRILDRIDDRTSDRLIPYNRIALLNRNYIDLNVFLHTKSLCDRFGGFDETLSSLEDWDLIIRYTNDIPPMVLNCCLADYYLHPSYRHLSFDPGLYQNYERIRSRYA